MNVLNKIFIACCILLSFIIYTKNESLAKNWDETTLPGQKCQLEPLDEWKPQEKWVWRQVCEGKIADFNKKRKASQTLNPNNPDKWKGHENRIITPRFLRTILLYEPFKKVLTERGVYIIGAWIKDEIVLTGGNIQCALGIFYSLFESNVILNLTTFASFVSFDGSKIDGTLNMEDACIGNSLHMSNNARFQKVNLRNIEINGSLSTNSSYFNHTLNMDSIKIGRSLFMREGAKFKEIILRGAQINGYLDMSGSTFNGKLNMNSVKIGKSFIIRNGAEFKEADWIGLEIGDQLEMDSPTFHGKLAFSIAKIGKSFIISGTSKFQDVVMESSEIEKTFFIQNSKFRELNLSDTIIGGQLGIAKSTFESNLDLYIARIGKSIIIKDDSKFNEVDMKSINIGGQLEILDSILDNKLNLDNAKIEGSFTIRNGTKLREVVLKGARIGETFAIDNATINGLLELGSAKIGKDVFLWHTKFYDIDKKQITSNKINMVFTKIGGSLDFRSSHLPTIDLRGAVVGNDLILTDVNLQKTWVAGDLDLRNAKTNRFVASNELNGLKNVLLNGFQYNFLGGFSRSKYDSRSSNETLLFIKGWLSNSREPLPNAFKELARVLINMGIEDQARLVMYESRHKQMIYEWKNRNFASAIWLTFLWAFIGYGYSLWYTLIWAFGLLMSGWWFARRSKIILPNSKETIGFWYSFDRLLPIIQLRKVHYEVDLDGLGRIYFYFHTIMGYVLSTFILAGLSGLVGQI